jgi:hypothetical protein
MRPPGSEARRTPFANRARRSRPGWPAPRACRLAAWPSRSCPLSRCLEASPTSRRLSGRCSPRSASPATGRMRPRARPACDSTSPRATRAARAVDCPSLLGELLARRVSCCAASPRTHRRPFRCLRQRPSPSPRRSARCWRAGSRTAPPGPRTGRSRRRSGLRSPRTRRTPWMRSWSGACGRSSSSRHRRPIPRPCSVESPST